MWTIPNFLTALRLLCVPAVAAVLALAGDSAGGRLTALILFGAASVTDLADGWLARRWGQCTDFGALADPIADKALVGTTLVCLSGLGLLAWWATAVILLREVAVTVLRLTVLRHGVLPASRGGKVKTATQTALIVLALAVPGWTVVLDVVVVGTVVWTLVTGLDYGRRAAVLRRGPVVLAVAAPAPGGVAVADGPGRPGGGRSAQQDGGADSSRVRS
ncbi:CDP-alcohol phosphatidyltransferase family protein [Blastococcus haudaquaticus]|uniref:CDP-diacylglycerol--glycerol-3-phosphate 3-phosphatidyltransferase n=1 Tax=Blastococcus haudaquaticus TaxID=1938745 RepID=A0A286GH50_9ACTN|nr:CDP-alcohol phosphatidyltransferase family protein [Blastococcus haudaquaticus]SOD94546.1 CDP-diacylglycerol--glycerol-3-phosphate 3-phosphatidyltransferase [Blastococcus haudaquaticus]